ncbi:MAG: SDR family NAD(P)-dependent oxidoreductase [Jatrophihabitans sp.]|uniref:SDR family NAD(P)-dependent oxidoreductase n=1 Tax=Jatrophihabitans sp. TaxID=1932789 RepID=UPI003F81B7BE
MQNYVFAGGTAVLTGAASGMGEQMAHQLAAKGSNLVLVDRDADRLATVADAIRAAHPQLTVLTEVADLADIDAIPSLAERILAQTPDVTLLINNAGVALGGAFEQVSREEFDWVMAINFQAPVALTRAFLPTLQARPGSHIVNLSSLFGLITPPGQSAYASSKFAIRAFSEVLRQELAPQGIGVTTVHPGGIKTRIAESARVASGASEEDERAGKEAFAKLLTFPADKAAAQILDGAHRRKARVVITPEAVAADLVARLFPSNYFAVLNRLRPGTTRNATGSARVGSSTPAAP